MREMESMFYLPGIEEFIIRCSAHPLYRAFNPTMMIICEQLVGLMKNEASQNPADFSAKEFFLHYLPEITRVFGAKNVKQDKLLQDLIVYFSHIQSINVPSTYQDMGQVEFSSEEDSDYDGVLQDDPDYDAGGESF